MATLRFVTTTAFVFTVIARTTSTASAQGAATPTPPPPAAQGVTASWEDGLVLQSTDGSYRLAFGMTAQTDGRFALNDPPPITNTFTIRKARPTLSGRVAKYFDFKVMPDFGSGIVILQDAYFDVRFSPGFRVRAGKDKVPVGYEVLISDANLLFPERSLVSSLLPNRDVGIQTQGELAGGKFSYAAGVFNGTPDGTSSILDVDTNSSKDLAGRVVWQPFRSSTAASRALKGLGFHLGGSSGQQVGPLPVFRTSVGQPYFSYVATALASGGRQRVSPAVFYYHKSFGGFAEYARSPQTVANAGTATDVANHAWDVTGSLILTGEPASDRGVRPKHSFDPANHQWGALQLLARYGRLTIDPGVFSAGLNGAGAVHEARQLTIGLNWYPSAYIKYYVTFEHTGFEGGAEGRRHEDVILFRTQLSF
jgi:phosphate-selective porin OprO/OprP